MPQESAIYDFTCRLPKNPDNFYLKIVGIPSFPKQTITKKIDFCIYDENDEADGDKWEVHYNREVGPFFGSIADDKEFDGDRENHVYMVGEENVKVKYQDGKFITLSSYKINAMKKNYLYGDIFQRCIKENKSTVNKSLKERFKGATQNRVWNVTMAKAIENALAHFLEMSTWRLLRTIDTPVVEPQNKFAVARAPKSQMTVNYRCR